MCEIEPTLRIVFANLDYKKTLSDTIQSVSIRTQTGQLVPFSGIGKVKFTFFLRKICWLKQRNCTTPIKHPRCLFFWTL